MCAAANLRAQVLGGYRRLLRSTKKTFGGDLYAVEQARQKLRSEFTAQKSVTSKQEIETLLKGIDDVEEFLSFHVVQGVQNERGNFDVKLKDQHNVKRKKDEELEHIDANIRTEPNKEGCGRPGGCGCAGSSQEAC